MKEIIPHSGYPCSVKEGKIIEYNGYTIHTMIDPLFEEYLIMMDDQLEKAMMEQHRKFMEDWWNGTSRWLQEEEPHKPKD